MRKYLLHILIISFVSILPNVVCATEAYNYMAAVISSLESCKIANERLKLSNSDEDETGTALMKDIIVTNSKIKEAAQFMEPYLLSKDETTKMSAKEFAATYAFIIQNNEDLLNFIEHTFNNIDDYADKQGTYTRKLSGFMATNEELWRMIPKLVALSTYALVDNERIEDGILKFLKISSGEAEYLKGMLVSTFGEEVKSELKAGMFPLDVSATSLYIFFGKGWKFTDAK
jgi:hypothetical protein